MSAPSKAYTNQSVKIRSEQRLATNSELNPAPGGVTCHREAGGMGYWAATQVKGLSPEIIIVSVADAVHLAAGNSLATVKRGCKNPTGSETVARYQTVCIGTWDPQCIPVMVCNDKSEKGKEMQMVHWESDQLIVAKKQGNSCGAKGLTKEPKNRDTSMQSQNCYKKENKTNSMIHSIRSEEVLLKSRVRENRKHGSVRGLVTDSGFMVIRRWL